MIDLYYWQHSDRRLAASKEEICSGWDPPDEARSVVGTGRAGCAALCGAAPSQTSGYLRRPAWTP